MLAGGAFAFGVHSLLATSAVAQQGRTTPMTQRVRRDGATHGSRAESSRRVTVLDSVARAFAARGELSGAVLVALNGAVVYQHAFGEANRELHVPNTVATRFRIASTTKQFTAALVLRLAEEGKLQLDAPIATYLPEYPRPQGERVTLRHLLTHTGGVPDYPRLPGFYDREVMRPHTVPELLALFDSLPLERDPGGKWSYSNSDYVILGAVIERVAGQPYPVALRERLLRPLGLNDTDYDDATPIVPLRASGYMRDSGVLVNAPYIDPSTVYAAGMLHSTVGDLFRWAELLRTGRVFRDSASLVLMTTPHAETGLPLGGYGFGVFIGNQTLGGRSIRVIQHGGTINGFTSGFWRMPAEGAVVVVLDNTMSRATPAVTAALAQTLFANTGRR
jgi:CubicO group peptidase (beta-lactamase class C family)